MTDVFVVDTSIVVQSLIQDTYSANTDILFAQYKTFDRLWVPEFCHLECINVLWKQVRFHGMPQAQAEQAIKDLHGLPLKVADVSVLYVRAFQIGVANKLAVYNAVYIALAEFLTYPLITVDEAQQRAALAEKISIKSKLISKPLRNLGIRRLEYIAIL